MFATQPHRIDFSDTRSAAADPLFALSGFGRFDHIDPAEQMAQADAADRTLLRLVFCAALGTLLLALASSIGA